MSKGCCKNETQVLKLKENFTPTQSVDIPSTDFISTFILAYVQVFNLSLTDCDNINLYADSNAPPGRPVPLTILYRSILI